jgi:hypothetical protein
VGEKYIRLPIGNLFHEARLVQETVILRIRAFCCHTMGVWNIIQPDEHGSFIAGKRLMETRYEIVQGSRRREKGPY